MKVGVVGLGLMGLPIATSLYKQGHEIFSWTQTPRVVPWINSNNLANQPPSQMDFLIVASGHARPSRGGVESEIQSTYELISRNFEPDGVRVIYLSSGAVYGECAGFRSENDLVIPSTEYGLAKHVTEKAFLSTYEENFCSLRIGNIVDWNSPYGLLQALSSALTERKMVFYGNPTDCRDYISIKDLTVTVSKLIQSQSIPELLNVGSGVPMQLSEIATLLMESLDGEIEIFWHQGGNDQLKETKLNIEKLKSTLEIVPTNPQSLFFDFLTEGHFA